VETLHTTPKDSSNEPKCLDHPTGDPVATPAPPMDGKKPIEQGNENVEKFLVITDTGGGD